MNDKKQERLKKNREDWARYGPAILDLMDRLDKLEEAEIE